MLKKEELRRLHSQRRGEMPGGQGVLCNADEVVNCIFTQLIEKSTEHPKNIVEGLIKAINNNGADPNSYFDTKNCYFTPIIEGFSSTMKFEIAMDLENKLRKELQIEIEVIPLRIWKKPPISEVPPINAKKSKIAGLHERIYEPNNIESTQPKVKETVKTSETEGRNLEYGISFRIFLFKT